MSDLFRKKRDRAFPLLISSISLCYLATTSPTVAQIVPDATLPVNSIVTPDGNTNVITGGTAAGGNLFHSFEEFSVPTGGTALFNNAVDIQNIFSRVTGGSISNIDGIIRANGSANLFLLNPNGIIFGPNAQLQIGGSFLGSTANSLKFADGSSFSATNPQTAPLLTISVPIGLQFGQNPGAITVRGTGHSLSRPDPIFGQIVRGGAIAGLQVQPGKTLALVGGDITLEGGTIAAPGGRIELGSVGDGFVSLSQIPPAPLNNGSSDSPPFSRGGIALGYNEVLTFRDIQLSQLASADASGDGGGSISVQGRRISVRDGSTILIQNSGEQPSGALSVNAAESVEISGTSPDFRIPTTIANETVGAGSGSDLAVNTRRLVVRDGGGMYSTTFSAGKAGNVTVSASDSVQVSGFSPLNPVFFSFIRGGTYSSAWGGNITISTGQLSLLGGGSVVSLTLGTGKAGDITVNASESVEAIGVEPSFLQPSALFSGTFNAGDAGKLTVNTPSIVVKDGGSLSASTFASGDAGSITINATESVEVSGTITVALPTNVSSAATTFPNKTLRERFRLPPLVSGSSGDVTINTRRLTVRDNGLVAVSNGGSGNAGTLTVNASAIFLDNYGGITAATASGEGGNIILQVGDLLQMRHNSAISARSGGTGNGGNLTINADVITALENSDIRANAFQGRGGNIQIKTQRLFGAEFREALTPESDITASSQFGLNGVVEVNRPDVDPSSGLVALPQTLVDVEKLVAKDLCAFASQGSSFVVTGRGGLPSNPNDALGGDPVRVGLVDPVPSASRGSLGAWELGSGGAGEHGSLGASSNPDFGQRTRLVEATGWAIAPNGQLVLSANLPSSTPHPSWLTPTPCRNRDR